MATHVASSYSFTCAFLKSSEMDCKRCENGISVHFVVVVRLLNSVKANVRALCCCGCSTTASLELYGLNLGDSGQDMELVGSIQTDSRSGFLQCHLGLNRYYRCSGKCWIGLVDFFSYHSSFSEREDTWMTNTTTLVQQAYRIRLLLALCEILYSR